MKTHAFVALLAFTAACQDSDHEHARNAPHLEGYSTSRSTYSDAGRRAHVWAMRAEIALVAGERHAIDAAGNALPADSPERERVTEAASALDSRAAEARKLVDALSEAPIDDAPARDDQARRAIDDLHRASADAWREVYRAARERLRPKS